MPKIEQLEDGKKLHVTLDDGTVFDGDPLEVTQKLAEAKENTYKWGKGLETERDELKKKVTAPPIVSAPPPTTEEAQLDGYLLERHAKALGFNNAAEYKAELADVRAVKERAKNQAVAADFIQQCPDFPNTDASIEALKGKMEKMGYDYTPQSMIAAHMLCLREDSYKPLSASEQNESWANNMARSSRGTNPPMIRSTSPEQTAPLDLWTEDPQKQRDRIVREQLAAQGR